MSIGYVHLFALPAPENDSKIAPVAMFQFTFSAGGHSYARVFDTTQLHEFLAEELGLQAKVLEEAMSDLLATGTATVADVELGENDAAVMGLVEAGADY